MAWSKPRHMPVDSKDDSITRILPGAETIIFLAPGCNRMVTCSR